MQYCRRLIQHPGKLLCIYVLIALVASIHVLLVPPHLFFGKPYTDYNNYLIFKQSFHHLLSHKNLYLPYPDEQWDLFKYSPTFALCMSAFAHLPTYIGLILWNSLNAIALYCAIRLLPMRNTTRNIMLVFLVFELLTNIQNAQCNGIQAGLLIGAHGCLQRGKAIGLLFAYALLPS
ncbi:MAG: hypothetical protein K0Q79_1585 [Flavipsychrobacter sp.]|nr:hypothetical protein [Flavipsychrobacter sp.]